MIRRLSVATYVLSSVLLLSLVGMAQMTTATLSGVVTDETGAVLPGVAVNVTNTATGSRRTVSSDAAGRFTAPQLVPGPYEATATMTGFETLRHTGITLAVGQQANLTLAMKVGAVTEQVTVTGEAPLVNTSSSAVAGLVEEKRIEELPLNGRDFSQLPLIQPGVSAVRNGDVTVSKGYGARIVMGGSRPDQTAWLLDGTNIKSTSNFGTPGSAAGVMLGVDAVREFQVLTSNYSAEFGGTSGGVINMVSKSGTNQLHGSLYEYLRNSALDARDFFDLRKPAFKRNQFGGSLGGPIKKDKSFFFGNYEGLRQRKGVTATALVPDANLHRGILPNGQQVTIAPAIRPYLDLMPLPTGTSSGGLGTLSAPANNPVGENYFVVRVDNRLTDKQSLFARFSFDQGHLTQPDAVPVTNTLVDVRTRYTTVQHDYVLSPQLLTTTRIFGNRQLLLSEVFPLVNYPASLNLFLPGTLPAINLPGATSFGPSSLNISGRVQNLYGFQESAQYIHGGHSMKFGAEITHVGSNKHGEAAGINGTVTWATLQNFLEDARFLSFSAAAPGSDTYRTFVQRIYGAYFHDDWKLRPNFTLNLGLRYEPFTTPSEKHGRISMLKDWVHDTAFDTNIGLFKNPSKKNLSPRVGFAWDPKGNGKTAIRAGFGLFFVDLLGAYFETAGQKNPPFFASTASVLGNLGSAASDIARIGPALLSPNLTPNTLPELINWNLNPSYEVKANLTIERQLPGNMSVSAGYLGDRGIHLWRLVDINSAPAILVNGRPLVVNGTPRVNPRAGAGSIRYSDAQSFYNALQLQVMKRLSRGFQFQSSYTWSKNVDDSSTGVAFTDFIPGGNGGTSQPYNPKADRGLSNLHQGQSLVINGIYSIPSPAKSGFASVVAGGWQISSIFTANSGVPFSVYVSGRSAPDNGRTTAIQHPGLVSGRSGGSIVSGTSAGCQGVTPGPVGTPNRYFDSCAFVLPPPAPSNFPAGSGYYGNAGRNILFGPRMMNFDFSLIKGTRLPISETSRLDFQAGFFNLFNRANFAVPRAPQAQVLNPTTGGYIAGAGRITNTVTTSRQLQFGLKLTF